MGPFLADETTGPARGDRTVHRPTADGADRAGGCYVRAMPPESDDDRRLGAELELGLPVWLPLAAKIKVSFERRWAARTKPILDALIERAGGDEDLGQRLNDDEQFAEMLEEGITSAAQSADPEYRDALASLIHAAFDDEAKIQTYAYLLSCLAQLDPLHLRVLREIIRVQLRMGNRQFRAGTNVPEPYLEEHVPADSWLVSSALQGLLSMGFVAYTPAPPEGRSYSPPPTPPAWSITDLGRHLLEVCKTYANPSSDA
jgi:hypothetical protein